MSESSPATRPYRSQLRARQAGETRRRVVQAASELFVELGYARTTLTKIAERAEVSPETVQAHGPKAALMRAATEIVGMGVEGVDDATQLPEVAAILTLPPEEFAEAVARWLLDLHRSLAGLMNALVGGAANDPDLAEYYRAILEAIHGSWGQAYDRRAVQGWVRTDRSRREVLDPWCVAASGETYLRLTDVYGWTDDEYAAWLTITCHDMWIGPAQGLTSAP